MSEKGQKKPKVKLIGMDGNAYAIIGACKYAWKRNRLPPDNWARIQKEMMSGDYDNLLRTAMKYFEVC